MRRLAWLDIPEGDVHPALDRPITPREKQSIAIFLGLIREMRQKAQWRMAEIRSEIADLDKKIEISNMNEAALLWQESVDDLDTTPRCSP